MAGYGGSLLRIYYTMSTVFKCFQHDTTTTTYKHWQLCRPNWQRALTPSHTITSHGDLCDLYVQSGEAMTSSEFHPMLLYSHYIHYVHMIFPWYPMTFLHFSSEAMPKSWVNSSVNSIQQPRTRAARDPSRQSGYPHCPPNTSCQLNQSTPGQATQVLALELPWKMTIIW